MFSSRDRKAAIFALTLLLAACEPGAPVGSAEGKLEPGRASPYAAVRPDLGRRATPAEVAAWDIDVRPDFSGLPPGQGSVAEGEEVWLARCASCHGDFGDANSFFSPLVLGNITQADIESGHVAALNDATRVRTTLMKVATVSTLWDYINRAMPWNDPKSLSVGEVYGLVAYLLNLAYIVDGDFVLSNENISEVQARMPNRNGMTRDHGLWKVNGRPDVQATACMSNCTEYEVTSFIPDFARNAHGNLRDQMRIFGPFQGVDTAGEDKHPQDNVSTQSQNTSNVQALLSANGCSGCHQEQSKLVGPAFIQVAEKYRQQAGAEDYLVEKMRGGSSGIWGGVMPAMPQLEEDQAREIARWLLSLKKSDSQ